MTVTSRRDGLPFLDCEDRDHTNTNPHVWDDAHMAALLTDLREMLRDLDTNDR